MNDCCTDHVMECESQLKKFTSTRRLRRVSKLPRSSVTCVGVSRRRVHGVGLGGLALGRLGGRPCLGFCRTGRVYSCHELGNPLRDVRSLGLLGSFPPSRVRELGPCVYF